MIRIFKLVVLLVISQVAFGQAPSNYTNINGRYRWIAGMFDSTFHIPKGSTPSLRTGGSTNSGGLFYNTSDSSVYTYTGTQWIKLRGSINPSDTTNKYVTQVYKKSGSDSIFYVKGGTHTWAFNDSTGSPGGGGGGKIYYFNGGVSMGTISGLQMYELGDTANTGTAANFTRSTTGNIANFITDPGKPGLLQIPAGVWSVDAWLSETGGGANHAEIWIEVEKWDGYTITTIATSPIEQITEGATPNLYSWSVSIPTTSLTVTDRIIIQFYISNTNGKTVTLYTQNGYVGEVHTTFTTGIGAINGLTAPAQYLVTGTSGTDFNINSSTATHTFNLPTASSMIRGALSPTDWSAFNNKIGPSDTASMLSPYLRSNVAAATYVPQTRTITINGTSQDLSANRTYNVGTVTSVATNTGTGITGGTITSSGTIAADTLLLSTRAWRQKGIDSVASLINTRISGTTNYIPKFTSSSAIGNSVIYEGTRSLGIGTATPVDFGAGTYNVNINDSGIPVIQFTNSTTGSGTSVGMRIQSVANDFYYINSQTTGSQIWYTNGSERMRLDASGNLGLGTSSPTALLDLYNTSGVQLRLANSTTGSSSSDGTRIYLSGNDLFIVNRESASIQLYTADTERMRLDASGNLGLGVTPSAANLPTIENQYGFFSGQGEINLTANAYYSLGFKYISTGSYAARYHQSGFNGQHQWFTAPSGTAGNAISFTQAMTLDASGRLGIGSTNPSNKLTVISSQTGTQITTVPVGKFVNTGNEFSKLIIGSDNANYDAVFSMDNNATLANTKLRIYIGNGTNSTAGHSNDQIVLQGNGNVGIGTTSPDTKLQVAETGSNGISVRANTSGDAYYRLYQDGTITSHWYSDRTNSKITFGAVTNIPLTFETNSTERMRITSGGNVGIGVTNPTEKLEVNGAIKTAAPSGGTAVPWKLGNKLSTAVTLDTGNYIPVEVNGVTYYLALVTLN